jgi:hypothetical protein
MVAFKRKAGIKLCLKQKLSTSNQVIQVLISALSFWKTLPKRKKEGKVMICIIYKKGEKKG